MPVDRVGTEDRVGAELNAVAAPRFPCPVCGKETKEMHPLKVYETLGETGVQKLKSITKRRVCSDRSCRHMITIQPS